MGGYGSGRKGWLPVIENGLKLDLRRLRRQGLFDGRSTYRRINLAWSWEGTGEHVASAGVSYSATPGDSWLALEYTVTREGERVPVKETFRLERFKQPFGGYRWYLRCPQTGRRCQCLYLPPGATRFRSREGFRCRLQYRSQQLIPRDRLLERGRSIAAKVLRAGPSDWQEKYEDWDFPPKPPGMRWATYDRHLAEWDRYEAKGEAYLAVLVAKLGGAI